MPEPSCQHSDQPYALQQQLQYHDKHYANNNATVIEYNGSSGLPVAAPVSPMALRTVNLSKFTTVRPTWHTRMTATAAKPR